MGGVNESVVKNDVEDAMGACDGVRVHVSGGEVHFHDDVRKLKVAVPVSRWYAIWGKLRDLSMESATLIDPDRLTQVDIRVRVKRGELSAKVSVSKCADSRAESFDALDRLAHGKKATV